MKPLEEESMPVKIAYWSIFFLLFLAISLPIGTLIFSLWPPSRWLIEIIVSTVAAAAAGTYGAQVAIERSKNKEILLQEIRNTNVAIFLAFDIFEAYFRFKKQHIKTLKETFDAQRAAYDEAAMRSRTTGQPGVFRFEADYRAFPTMYAAEDTLHKQIFEKVSVGTRSLALTNAIVRAVESLNKFITERNQLIQSYKTENSLPQEYLVKRYFGLPDGQGRTDQLYSNIIDALYSQTDDCIQFSKMLCEDLVKHGEEVRKKLGRRAPKITTPMFEGVANTGLLPDPKDYPTWFTHFIEASDA